MGIKAKTIQAMTVVSLAFLGLGADVAAPARDQNKLEAGRVAQLTTIGIDGSEPRVVYQTTDHIEAPNWSPDGRWLIVNFNGSLWRIAAEGGGKPQLIPTGDVTDVNNDHILSPDGQTIYFSAAAHLYAVPFAGGQPRRISNDHEPQRQFKHFLHGISPDGKTLAFVGVEAVGKNAWGRLDLYTIPATGGADTRLTDTAAPDDGPEYSPDGNWIYFNSELNAKVAGHAQIYRMKPDGTGIEQLTSDERVNWFPHLSRDGKWIVYISFPPGTVHHPANKPVILRRMKPDGSQQADITSLPGGQGTINVNSWSPDNKRFALVAYPLESKH
jgi:TolB protein